MGSIESFEHEEMVIPKGADGQENLPPINIGWKAETEAERLLSNFSESPFELDGKKYASVEGFWQSLKTPDENKKEKIATLTGNKAKQAGKEFGRDYKYAYHQGERMLAGSLAHQKLMIRALRAKFSQDPAARQALLSTGDREITHILETPDGKKIDSQTIPGKLFAKILMEIRRELREADAGATDPE